MKTDMSGLQELTRIDIAEAMKHLSKVRRAKIVAYVHIGIGVALAALYLALGHEKWIAGIMGLIWVALGCWYFRIARTYKKAYQVHMDSARQLASIVRVYRNMNATIERVHESLTEQVEQEPNND